MVWFVFLFTSSGRSWISKGRFHSFAVLWSHTEPCIIFFPTGTCTVPPPSHVVLHLRGNGSNRKWRRGSYTVCQTGWYEMCTEDASGAGLNYLLLLMTLLPKLCTIHEVCFLRMKLLTMILNSVHFIVVPPVTKCISSHFIWLLLSLGSHTFNWGVDLNC